MLKKIFVSRPMNGVTIDEDNKRLKEIREALSKEHVIGNFVNAEIINTWEGPVVPNGISDEQTRVWRLGRAISEMATADVLIFIPSDNKGCQVEFKTYMEYKDVMADKWLDVFVYQDKELKRLNIVGGFSGRYPWGSGKNPCVDDVANLIADLTKRGYPNELIEDAVDISKKILDIGRTNM